MIHCASILCIFWRYSLILFIFRINGNGIILKRTVVRLIFWNNKYVSADFVGLREPEPDENENKQDNENDENSDAGGWICI